MKIIDISWPITVGMTEYKDRTTVRFEKIKDFPVDEVRETVITFHSHTGTHVDAPSHFLNSGRSIDDVSLPHLIGSCNVIEIDSAVISVSDLEKHTINRDDIILFKTKNSAVDISEKFKKNFVYLEKQAAQYIADKKVKSVGIDYLGIEREQSEHETHKILLRSDIPIIEGLRLKEVKPGTYFLICLPIKLVGLDAAPARAILLDKKPI